MQTLKQAFLTNFNSSYSVQWCSEQQCSMELDRFSRHDNGGGEDGDEWLEDDIIEQETADGAKQYAHVKLDALQAVKKANIKASVYFTHEEKGHFYLNVMLDEFIKVKKVAKTVAPTQTTQAKRVYTYTNKALNLVSNPEKVRNLLKTYLAKQSIAQVKACKTIRANIATSVNITTARANVLIRDNIEKVYANMQK